jgi:hypothetical protein
VYLLVLSEQGGAANIMDSAFVEPEEICPESIFQSALARALEQIVGASPCVMTQSFGLDIALFLGTASGTCVRFLEIKSFGGQRMGGVGFGNGRGEGPQVDLLLNDERQIALLDSCVRWVFALKCDNKLRPLPRGAARYAILSCNEAKAAAMGTVARGKQNNFRISALSDRLIRWDQLVNELRSFVR